MTPYHFGVAICLRDMLNISSSSCDVWRKHRLVVSGVSGGALVAALFRYAPETLNEAADFVCNTNKTLSGVLSHLSDRDIVSEDSLEVCVSRLSDGQLVRLNKHTNGDLEDALRAATFIPRDFHPFDLLSQSSRRTYNSGHLYKHKELYFDAGICGHFMPFDDDTAFGISPFSLSKNRNTIVCPEDYHGNTTKTPSLTITKSNININIANLRRFHIAMFGGSEKILRSLVHNGYSDCARMFPKLFI